MNRRHSQRSPTEHFCGTPVSGLLHRVRRASAFARRSTRRKEAAVTGTVLAIEDQLQTLRPTCSAQRVSSGTACGAPAVAIAEIHAIDGCNQMGLTPGGNLVETLCRACLVTLQSAMAAYVGEKRAAASRSGRCPVCTTCGRSTVDLPSVFAVSQLTGDGR